MVFPNFWHPLCSRQLLVAFDSSIWIFDQADSFQWIKRAQNGVLECSDAIVHVDVNALGLVLATTGPGLFMFKTDEQGTWSCTWKTPGTDLHAAKFCTNGKLFASCQKNDTSPKIWYASGEEATEGAVLVKSLTLKHVYRVFDFFWRPCAPNEHDVLVTMSVDGVYRFWCQTISFDGELEFYLQESLDPLEWINARNMAFDYLSTNVTEPLSFIDIGQVLEGFENAPEHAKDLLAKQRQDVLLLQKYQNDMLFRCQTDGSVIFWGVSDPAGVAHVRYYQPKIAAMSYISSCLTAKQVEYFQQTTQSFSRMTMPVTRAPYLFNITECMFSPRKHNGHVGFFNTNLASFSTNSSTQPFLKQIASFTPHPGSITLLKQHPCRDDLFCAVSSESFAVYASRDFSHPTCLYECSEAGSFTWIERRDLAENYLVLDEGGVLKVLRFTDGVEEFAFDQYVSDADFITSHTFSDVTYAVAWSFTSLKANIYRIQIGTEVSIELVGDIATPNMKSVTLVSNEKLLIIADTDIHIFQLDSLLKLVAIGSWTKAFAGTISRVEVLESSKVALTFAHTVDTNIVVLSLSMSGEVTLDDTMRFQGPVEAFWYCKKLAVAFPENIRLYSLAPSLQGVVSYKQIAVVAYPTNVSGSRPTAVSQFGGSFVCAFDEIISVIQGSASCLADPTEILEKYPTLEYRLTIETSMPDYHPYNLQQHLMWGNFYRVSAILLHLYNFLYVADGQIPAEIPATPIEALLCDASSNNFVPSGAGLFDGDVVETETDFRSKHAEFLIDKLSSIALPRLSGSDQMYLLAIIDTFVKMESNRRGLDENALRYLLSSRLFMYLGKTLPPHLRPTQLDHKDLVWGLHSDSQDSILEALNSSLQGKMMWSDARSLGLACWIKNGETLKKQLELVARNMFMNGDGDKDPIKCALIYLSLKKRKLWQGLWKTANGHPEQASMLKFLLNDFTQERWKTAAAKNAFVLLGKQRFEFAAAFFLLAEQARDAVSVCLKQMKDLQLAVAVARLHEGEDSQLVWEIYQQHFYQDALVGQDRWKMILGLALLNKQDETVIASCTTSWEAGTASGSPKSSYPDVSLVIFNRYLMKKLKLMNRKSPLSGSPFEFWTSVAKVYDELGCPLFVLDIARIIEEESKLAPTLPISEAPASSGVDAGTLDWNWDRPAIPTIHTAASLFDDQPIKKHADLFDYEPVSHGSSSSAFFSAERKPHTAASLFDSDSSSSAIPSNVPSHASRANTASALFDDETSMFDNNVPASFLKNMTLPPKIKKDTAASLFDDLAETIPGDIQPPSDSLKPRMTFDPASLQYLKRRVALGFASSVVTTLGLIAEDIYGFQKKKPFWTFEEAFVQGCAALLEASSFETEFWSAVEELSSLTRSPATLLYLKNSGKLQTEKLSTNLDSFIRKIPLRSCFNSSERFMNFNTLKGFAKIYYADTKDRTKESYFECLSRIHLYTGVCIYKLGDSSKIFKYLHFFREFRRFLTSSAKDASNLYEATFGDAADIPDLKLEESELLVDTLEIEHFQRESKLVVDLLDIAVLECFLLYIDGLILTLKSLNHDIADVLILYTEISTSQLSKLTAWDAQYSSLQLDPYKTGNPLMLLSQLEQRLLWKFLFAGELFILAESQSHLDKFIGKSTPATPDESGSEKGAIHQRNSAKAMGLKVLQKLNFNRSGASIVSV